MKSDLVNYAAAEWRPWLARSHDEPRSIYNRASMRNRVLVACVVMGVSLAAGFATFRILRRVPKESGRILAQTSDDWGSIPFGNRECALVNNTWNRAAAGQEFEQFVFVEEEAGRLELGWRWRAPWHFWPTVVSQPQIVCGNKPWDPKTRPDDGFPFRAGTRRVTVNFDVHLRASGVYNMVFSLWAVSGVPPSRRDITHEIMIWTAYASQSPAGRRVDSLAIQGRTYDVYIEPRQTDASGQNSNTWTYVAFVPAKPVFHGPLEISLFLDYLLRRGTLGRDRYLTSLEFGNEVSQGTGIAEIRGFAISMD